MIKDIQIKAADQLRRTANEIERLPGSECQIDFNIPFKNISNFQFPNDQREIFRDKKFDFAIYTFKLSCGTAASECIKKIGALKELKKDKSNYRACPKINRIHRECWPWLYVGSSRNIFRRLNEHIGNGCKSTYALQLRHWASDISGGVQISVYGFGGDSSLLRYLPYLEEQLASDLKPIMGKHGNL